MFLTSAYQVIDNCYHSRMNKQEKIQHWSQQKIMQPKKETKLPFTEAESNLEGELKLLQDRDFPGGSVVKNPPANAGDTAASPGRGRSHMPRSN